MSLAASRIMRLFRRGHDDDSQSSPLSKTPKVDVGATSAARNSNQSSPTHVAANGPADKTLAAISNAHSNHKSAEDGASPMDIRPDVLGAASTVTPRRHSIGGSGSSLQIHSFDDLDGTTSQTTPGSASAGRDFSVSFSSVDDDDNDNLSANRSSRHNRIVRQTSLASSTSCPGYFSEAASAIGSDVWWSSEPQQTVSETGVPYLATDANRKSNVENNDRTHMQDGASIGAKSTFIKNPKRAGQKSQQQLTVPGRRATVEVKMSDLVQAASDRGVQLDFSAPRTGSQQLTVSGASASDDGFSGTEQVALRHSGSLKMTRPVSDDSAIVLAGRSGGRFSRSSVKAKSDTVSKMTSGTEISANISQLAEGVDFEMRSTVQAFGRTRSANDVTVINEYYSNPGLQSGGPAFTTREVIVLKPSSRRNGGTTFTLKKKVQLADVWISDSVSVDGDAASNDVTSKSFVIGYPTVNYVATFPVPDQKRRCFERLQKLCNDRRAEQMQEKVLKIVRKYEKLTVTKSLNVSASDSANRIVQRCMREFHLNESDAKDYQLVVQMTKLSQPVGLVGYELPLAIVLHESKRAGLMTTQSLDSSDQLTSQSQNVMFFLMPRDKSTAKQSARRPRSPLTLFAKRSSPSLRPTPAQSKNKSAKSTKTSLERGQLFGRSVEDLLLMLYEHGPVTSGVFRTPPSLRQIRLLKEKLDTGHELTGEDFVTVHMAASLIKELLRSLPDSLLKSQWYPQWMDIMREQDLQLRKKRVIEQVLRLPPANSLVLRHLLCVLCRVADHADESRMTSANLAVCIAQSLLWDLSANAAAPSMIDAATSQSQVVQLVHIIIDNVAEIWPDPADCRRLLDDRLQQQQHFKHEGQQQQVPREPTMAASSLYVHTASSLSLSDSEDPGNALDKKTQVAEEINEDFDDDDDDDEDEIMSPDTPDQMSPSSRDSGLALGGPYRGSNEDMATVSSSCSSSAVTPDEPFPNGGKILDLSAPSSASSSVSELRQIENQLPPSHTISRLPDILEGQTVNRFTDSITNTSPAVGGLTVPTSRTTGNARERIHSSIGSKLPKHSSGDSAIGRSSIEDQNSPFEISSSLSFDNEVIRVDAVPTPDPVPIAEPENTKNLEPKPLDDADGVALPAAPLSGPSLAVPFRRTVENLSTGSTSSPSGIDALFFNLSMQQQQQFGGEKSDQSTVTSSKTKLTSSDDVDHRRKSPVLSSSLVKRDEGLDVVSVPSSNGVSKAGSDSDTRIGKLLMMHNRYHNVKPAHASPEFWPTTSKPAKADESSLPVNESAEALAPIRTGASDKAGPSATVDLNQPSMTPSALVGHGRLTISCQQPVSLSTEPVSGQQHNHHEPQSPVQRPERVYRPPASVVTNHTQYYKVIPAGNRQQGAADADQVQLPQQKQQPQYVSNSHTPNKYANDIQWHQEHMRNGNNSPHSNSSSPSNVDQNRVRLKDDLPSPSLQQQQQQQHHNVARTPSHYGRSNIGPAAAAAAQFESGRRTPTHVSVVTVSNDCAIIESRKTLTPLLSETAVPSHQRQRELVRHGSNVTASVAAWQMAPTSHQPILHPDIVNGGSVRDLQLYHSHRALPTVPAASAFVGDDVTYGQSADRSRYRAAYDARSTTVVGRSPSTRSNRSGESAAWTHR